MAEEISFEKHRISNFEGIVTLTLDRVILHTYMPNVIEIKETFWTDGRTYVRMHAQTDGHFKIGFIRSTLWKST